LDIIRKEKKMKKILAVSGIIIFCFLLAGICQICAAEENASNASWKQEIMSDKQQIHQQREEMKADTKDAKAEEKALRQQINDAIAAGDTAKAAQLKEQLKSMHHENVQEMKQDKTELKESRKEFNEDVKAKWNSIDSDNNPPGPRGGPRTNWENPPGPKGGPGASPDRKGRRRF